MDTKFREKVEQLLKEKGMSQRIFASKLGVSEVTVSRWLTEGDNGRNPKSNYLAKMAEILGTDLDYLLGKDKQEQKQKSSGSVLDGLVITAGVVIAAVALAKAAGLLGEKDKDEIEKILNEGGEK